jgi:hypothetical protein
MNPVDSYAGRIHTFFMRLHLLPLLSVAFLGMTLLLSVGCGAPQESYGDDYKVIIDPNFSAEDTTALLDGITAWETISNGLLHLNPVIGTGGECSGKPAAHVLCVHTSDVATIVRLGGESSFVGYTQREDNDGASLFIPVSKDVGYSAAQMTIIFSHELGHCFGLSHIKELGIGVMFPGFNGATALPTCVDYAQLTSMRNGASFNDNPVCKGKSTSYTIDDTPGK